MRLERTKPFKVSFFRWGYAGVSPIFIGSGGTGKKEKSRQGNRKLNSLFYELAVQQVQFAKGKEKKARNPVMRATIILLIDTTFY